MRSIFRHPNIGSFFQTEPQVGHPYIGDIFLRRILERLLPPQIHTIVDKDLCRFGARVKDEIEPLGKQCETNEPYLVQSDAWGKRIDEVVTCDAWKTMKTISAEEGLVSIGYERQFGEHSRIYQFAKLFLYAPASGVYSCPLAMTDGAAKTIENLKTKKFQDVYNHLISKESNKFWTSGQWMTERKGGSDVANGTETFAIKQDNGKYLLYGYKWFSSATDADIALTLGRIADSNGKTTEGSSGLSMFLLKTRKENGSLNNIQVVKLKNKLGTRGLPTGELLLDGTEAELASDPGRGVSAISSMLTVTRMYNTLGSVVAMRRVALLGRDYSKKRSCFGKEIHEWQLHTDTLANLELEARAGTVLVFELARLLGIVECRQDSEEEAQLLRILTPVAKLYTAKKCMSVVSEGLECFGGQGYIEDTGLPAILRNAQVTPIWEGTTNILSMDMLRAVAKSKGQVLAILQSNLSRRLHDISSKTEFHSAIKILENELDVLVATFQNENIKETIARARILAFSIAEISIGAFLLEHAAHESSSETDAVTALRWVQNMSKLQSALENHNFSTGKASHDLVFDGYDSTNKLQSKL